MTKKILMTANRRWVLDLLRTGPARAPEIQKALNLKSSGCACTMLKLMADCGLIVASGSRPKIIYSLPSPDPQTDAKAAKPVLKASIAPPSSKSMWEQIESVLSTTARMSLSDIMRAGVPNDGRLHRMLKEMYSAGKVARWLAGDHYVYTLVNTLHPATAKLKDFVPPETFKKEYVALPAVSPQLADLHEKLDAPAKPAKAPVDEVSVIGENVLGEMAALRAELEAARKQLAEAREGLRAYRTYSLTLPKLAGGASWEDFYTGDVSNFDYDAAVAMRDELQAQLEA